MTEPMVRIAIGSLEETSVDIAPEVDMFGDGSVEVVDAADATAHDAGAAVAEPTFLDYLRSPIVELLIGPPDAPTLLTAHQALLTRSPFLSDAIARFSETATTRRIEMAGESLEAMGCLLQFLYTGEYYPRKIKDNRLEAVIGGGGDDDADADDDDDGSEQLLRHARVYTLAEKLGLLELKALAHSKVHLVNSTARGEMAYARYVYGHTPRSDATIRRPIASFWGQRSHVLRHEAEADFKALCIEYPEFAFDVLTHVLDSREKRSGREEEATKSGRKRQRNV